MQRHRYARRPQVEPLVQEPEQATDVEHAINPRTRMVIGMSIVNIMADVIDTGYEVSLKCHKYVTATDSVVLKPHSRY